jgi:hypothetical protein
MPTSAASLKKKNEGDDRKAIEQHQYARRKPNEDAAFHAFGVITFAPPGVERQAEGINDEY